MSDTPKKVYFHVGELANAPDVLAALLALDCGTWQAHYRPETRTLTFYRVSIDLGGTRCPVIVGGERCGDVAGHEGKHQWGRGD